MTAPAIERATVRRPDDPSRHALLLRRAAAIYVVAILVHGADHLRRGIDVVTAQVRAAGGIQLVLALLVFALAARGHRWAPAAAASLGFTGAALFIAVHFVPYWGSFSDSFTGNRVGPNVTALSWAGAIIEIAAGIALGWVGLRAFRNTVAAT